VFSYLFMKILEGRPRRYDRGIRLLSFGRSESLKHRIAAEEVRPGFRVLEIGVGTGTLALLAAHRGASVLGFDISAGMLEIAKRKVTDSGLSKQVDLLEMGVAQMDRLPDSTFDLVASTLVFSELSQDEQQYALCQAARLLKPCGRLVLADEALPGGLLKRLLYKAIRFPLLLLTFALTQTSTRAVRGLEPRVRDAGFQLLFSERTFLDSFLYLVAEKGAGK